MTRNLRKNKRKRSTINRKIKKTEGSKGRVKIQRWKSLREISY